MDDLIARIEAAKRGTRKLSDEVLMACGWSCINPDNFAVWRPPDNGPALGGGYQPHPTRSIDDAMALGSGSGMLPSFFPWMRDRGCHESGEVVYVGQWIDLDDPPGDQPQGHAASPALALTAACLKARNKELV